MHVEALKPYIKRTTESETEETEFLDVPTEFVVDEEDYSPSGLFEAPTSEPHVVEPPEEPIAVEEPDFVVRPKRAAGPPRRYRFD